MYPLIALLGTGLAVAAAAVFWARLQNWLADMIQRIDARSQQITQAARTAQDALVTLDRVMVNGQRAVRAVLRVFMRETSPDTSTDDQTIAAQTTELHDVRTLSEYDLPPDVLRKLRERGAAVYQLQLPIPAPTIAPATTNKSTPHDTYRLVVRSDPSADASE